MKTSNDKFLEIFFRANLVIGEQSLDGHSELLYLPLAYWLTFRLTATNNFCV